MALEDLADWATVIGVALIIPQFAFAIIAHNINQSRERKRVTLDYYEAIQKELKTLKLELRDVHGTAISKANAKHIYDTRQERIKLNKVLNIYDRLASGVNLGVYHLGTIEVVYGTLLIENYERFRNYILYYGEQKNRESWSEFTKLYRAIQKRRR